MNSYSKAITKVSIITIIGNVLLSIGKIVIGIIAHVSALISDGIHSVSDVGSTIVVMIGAKISTKKPDFEHPYGHERYESISSIILAMILGATAILLGYNGVVSIIDFVNGQHIVEHNYLTLALIMAIVSIVVKFLMFLYTYIVAKKINSTSLKADGYHHLSDSLSSFGSLLGIIGLKIGGNWEILDPIASIIIALFILKVAIDIAKVSIGEVVDKIKIWGSDYPKEFPICGYWEINPVRHAIGLDCHDDQNPGSSSRDMGDKGSVYIKERNIEKHRNFKCKVYD